MRLAVEMAAFYIAIVAAAIHYDNIFCPSFSPSVTLVDSV